MIALRYPILYESRLFLRCILLLSQVCLYYIQLYLSALSREFSTTLEESCRVKDISSSQGDQYMQLHKTIVDSAACIIHHYVLIQTSTRKILRAFHESFLKLAKDSQPSSFLSAHPRPLPINIIYVAVKLNPAVVGGKYQQKRNFSFVCFVICFPAYLLFSKLQGQCEVDSGRYKSSILWLRPARLSSVQAVLRQSFSNVMLLCTH